MKTQEAVQILISHDMLEEAEKLERIAGECKCVDCNNMDNQDSTEQCQGYPWARFKRGDIEPRKNQLAEISELQEQHSHATQAMFTEFVRMYREIQSMKINPEWLARTWKI